MSASTTIDARLGPEDEVGVRDLLVGRQIVSAIDDKLVLDNGTEITVIPNEGCGGCSAGHYWIELLARCEAVITSVRMDVESKPVCDEEKTYRIFVLAGDREELLLSVAGDDGNGYYGTGYELRIKKAKP